MPLMLMHAACLEQAMEDRRRDCGPATRHGDWLGAATARRRPGRGPPAAGREHHDDQPVTRSPDRVRRVAGAGLRGSGQGLELESSSQVALARTQARRLCQ